MVLDGTKRQWVDLGDLSVYTCMMDPVSCGESGGSVAVWMKILNFKRNGGILTTIGAGYKRGFVIKTDGSDDIRYIT